MTIWGKLFCWGYGKKSLCLFRSPTASQDKRINCHHKEGSSSPSARALTKNLTLVHPRVWLPDILDAGAFTNVVSQRLFGKNDQEYGNSSNFDDLHHYSGDHYSRSCPDEKLEIIACSWSHYTHLRRRQITGWDWCWPLKGHSKDTGDEKNYLFQSPRLESTDNCSQQEGTSLQKHSMG